RAAEHVAVRRKPELPRDPQSVRAGVRAALHSLAARQARWQRERCGARRQDGSQALARPRPPPRVARQERVERVSGPAVLGRVLGCALLGGLLLLPLGTGSAAAGPPELSVRLECQRRPTPGRVLCEAEIELASGLLRWADVLVVAAPEFA